jgi:hypothetical protein
MKKLLLIATLIAGSVFAFAGGKKEKIDLWQELARRQSDYEWIDLSFEVSPETPHWYGFDTFPRIKGGTGFTSRVFAISPK